MSGARPGGGDGGGAGSDGESPLAPDHAPVYVISVAADLAGMHPQTLRQYDRLGLVRPSRTPGRGRRYSARDVLLLREVQRLSQVEGVNLAGVERIIALETRLARAEERAAALVAERDAALALAQRSQRVFAAGAAGEVVAVQRGRRARGSAPRPGALVVWRPQR